MKRVLIAFDVDDTLTVGNVARTDIVNVLKALDHCGRVDLMVWSGGGAAYARMWCDRLGISENIPCYSKLDPNAPRPDMAWDDSEFFNKADLVVNV